MAATRRAWCASSSRCTPSSQRAAGFSLEILHDRPGLIVAEVAGKGSVKAFAIEAGGHRWQRVPPTERRGRRHTSTVTVAVLPVDGNVDESISESDIEWSADRGSGPGGQAKNKTANAVRMTHMPTGISVRVETSRSQYENRVLAQRMIAAKITQSARADSTTARATERQRQIGSGMRGDKIRTVRLQDDSVTDHRTGKRMTAARYLRGHVDELA